jgi:glycosyltransferase involved in cell wall biosynthesis
VLSFEGKPAALFVDASDNTKLADAVSRLLADQALSGQLRRNARGLKARYSVGTMVDEYVAILDQAI